MSETFDVVTWGELLGVVEPLALRSPLQSSMLLEMSIGGAEVNVALSLARLGHCVGWCGAVGDDPFGRSGVHLLRGEGVDVSRVVVSPSAPTGVYFKEMLSSGRLRTYVYRDRSAASRTTWADIDLDYLLSGRAIHLTGITALISERGGDLLLRLMKEARVRGVHVSFDANVRRRLLRGRDPVALLAPLAHEADTVFVSRSEAMTLFGCSDPVSLQSLLARMHGETVVVHDAFGAHAVTADATAEVDARRVDLVDPTGAGDALVAGYLSGWLEELTLADCLVRAEHCASRAVSSRGDNPVGLDHPGTHAVKRDER